MQNKVDKTKNYKITFQHCINLNDIEVCHVIGREFFRYRNSFNNWGYEIMKVEEVKSV